MSKICPHCGEEKDLSAFSYDKKCDRVSSWCKACSAKSARRSWAKRSEESKKAHNLRKYGLTLSDYEALLVESAGHCAICAEPFGPSGPQLDHDHDTGKVRHLLCTRCNTGLGKFKDSANLLIQAAKYIQRYE